MACRGSGVRIPLAPQHKEDGESRLFLFVEFLEELHQGSQRFTAKILKPKVPILRPLAVASYAGTIASDCDAGAK